ncbi:MAG: hypothetical protein ABI085_14725 [Gemmatimonadaceae bacterium]
MRCALDVRSGSPDGTLTGTCAFPNVILAFDMPGYESLTYIGTLSQTAAKIEGMLNGSGFTNLELDIAKK